MDITKIYYAHSMRIYDTTREDKEYQFLSQLGVVDNPNDGLGKRRIEDFLKRVLHCDQIICSEYKGYIGRGVYEELTVAISENIPAYVLRKRKILGRFHLKEVKALKIVNDSDWQIRFGKVKV